MVAVVLEVMVVVMVVLVVVVVMVVLMVVVFVLGMNVKVLGLVNHSLFWLFLPLKKRGTDGFTDGRNDGQTLL